MQCEGPVEKASRQVEDFHRLQLERLEHSAQAVQLDELHGRVAKPPKKQQNPGRSGARGLPGRVAGRVGLGFAQPCRS